MPMNVTHLDAVTAFTTKDGSQIRELAHPAWTTARAQSLAEATVPVGGATAAHWHPVAEELYLITHGTGRLRLAHEISSVVAGDCIVIPPGTEHALENTGDEPLRLLCCCAPAYSDEDTVLASQARA
jgi:mannose-6-phosphate isomerase-like protein (cupin superfamily)